jgi:hypothetical protein
VKVLVKAVLLVLLLGWVSVLVSVLDSGLALEWGVVVGLVTGLLLGLLFVFLWEKEEPDPRLEKLQGLELHLVQLKAHLMVLESDLVSARMKAKDWDLVRQRELGILMAKEKQMGLARPKEQG